VTIDLPIFSDNAPRKHPLAKCEECPLCIGSAFVPTKFPDHTAEDGTHPSGIAVVGEAPGLTEANKGIPFVGASGRLLDKVLAYHRIDRRDVTLTNACLCRPPDNATPPKLAVECCAPRLVEDLRGHDRILALGNTAARPLLSTTQGILALRVGPRRPAKMPGVQAEVVPTIHPAACLRSGDRFPDLVTDVGKLKGNHKPWQPPQYVVLDDEKNALSAIQQLNTMVDTAVVNRLYLDIEAGIDKDNSFDHPNRYQLLCIGVGYAKRKVAVFGETALTFQTVIEALKKLFNRVHLAAQNGKFDLGGLYPKFGDLRLWFDTMLAHYVLDERPGGHGLGAMGQELLGTPDWKKDIAKYLTAGKNYANIPRPILYKYNANDVSVGWDLMEDFEQQLEQPIQAEEDDFLLPQFQKLRDVHDFLVAASNELKFLELNGIAIDRAYSRELSTEFLGELAKMEEQFDGMISRDYDKKGGINPRSPKQVKTYFEDNKILVKSTNADTLETLLGGVLRREGMERVQEFVELLLQHRGTAKKHGTFVKGIRERTYRGRVYTTYLLHGTTSGRLASRNPNLQNIMRDKRIRRQFVVSKPGNIFVHADYKQAEGRVITTLAQDEYLRSIFEDPNVDLFDNLSDQLYGVGNWQPKKERVRTKAYFYGLSYGRDAYSIAMEYGMSVREAEKGLSEFFDLIPSVASWQRKIKQRILDGKDLITPFGRSRRFMLITKENKKDVLNEGLSFLPQSTASDICLSALIRLRPMLRGKAFIRLTIHDALAAECAEESKDEVAEIMTRVMVEEGRKFTDYVPFSADVSFGTDWGML
jgi:uracil-DNA glycosylase family 4